MPFQEVKPNIKKVFLMNIIEIVSVALFIALLAVMFISLIGIEFFSEMLGMFGITSEVKLWHILLWFISAIVAVIAVILSLNYVSLGNVRYEFQKDKIVYYSCFLFVLINSKEVPYGNVSRISFGSEGFLNGLFKTGAITLELTAMKEKELKMDFIDNAEQVARYIQKMIGEYKSRYYSDKMGYKSNAEEGMAKSEEKRIREILDEKF